MFYKYYSSRHLIVMIILFLALNLWIPNSNWKQRNPFKNYLKNYIQIQEMFQSKQTGILITLSPSINLIIIISGSYHIIFVFSVELVETEEVEKSLSITESFENVSMQTDRYSNYSEPFYKFYYCHRQ